MYLERDKCGEHQAKGPTIAAATSSPVDNEDDTGVGVCKIKATADLRCRRRGEDLSGHGSGEHASADEACVAGLVTGTTAGNDGHLVGRVGAVVDDLVRRIASKRVFISPL